MNATVTRNRRPDRPGLDRDRIAKLIAAGVEQSAIAAREGVSIGGLTSAIAKWRKGGDARFAAQKADPVAVAATGWAENRSLKQIADELGTTRSAVSGMISRSRAANPDAFPRRRAEGDASMRLPEEKIEGIVRRWNEGESLRSISAVERVGQHTIERLMERFPARFPAREKPRAKIAARPPAAALAPARATARDEAPGPETGRAAPVRASAFSPLAGRVPALLWNARGCRWPVHPSGDAMALTLLVCDAPTAAGASWCAEHAAMACTKRDVAPFIPTSRRGPSLSLLGR